jgi:hypothetical protein
MMRCARRCAIPTVAVVLLDLVIGYGAHANPAAHLAAIVAGRRCRCTGPRRLGDRHRTRPPGLARRRFAVLEQAGIVVAPSNAQACELALALSANDVRMQRYANT